MPDLRRSLVVNFLSSSGATIVQFVVSVLLARILSPAEIGLFSITVVFVNIAHIFRDFGVAAYLQREQNLTPEKLRAALGVLFTTSWLIALILYFASSSIESWFGKPGIAPVMRILSIGFLFIPFGAVTNSLLTREFAAGKQAIVVVAGTASFAATALGLAALGFGALSLAWANLVNILVCALAYVPLRPKGLPWLPSFRNWRSVVHFGFGSLASNCATAINNAIPDIFLGRIGTAHEVGLYSRANSTVTIFTHVAGSTVNYGSVSYISRAHQSGQLLTPLLSRAVSLLTGIGWPVLAITVLFRNEIVLVLYGSTWLEAVPAMPAIAVAAGVAMMFNYTPAALTAVGRPYLFAVPVAIMIVARVGFGLLLFSGSISDFAWAICFASLITIPVMLFQQTQYLGYRAREMVHAVLPSAGVTVICLLVGEALRRILPDSIPAIVRLVIISLPMLAVWYMALVIMRHVLLSEVNRMIGTLAANVMRLVAAKRNL